MSMPLKGLAASWNQFSSWICCVAESVDGWNSSIHLLIVASAALARMTPGIAKAAPAVADCSRNAVLPTCHFVVDHVSLSTPSPADGCSLPSSPARRGVSPASCRAAPQPKRMHEHEPDQRHGRRRPQRQARSRPSQARWIHAAPSRPMNSRSPRVVRHRQEAAPLDRRRGELPDRHGGQHEQRCREEDRGRRGPVHVRSSCQASEARSPWPAPHTRPRAKPLAM